MSLRARRGDPGFTLIEMVVGITLMAIVAVGFAASVHLGFRTIALARQRQTASEVASARLEHLRSVPLDQIALSPVATTDPPDTPPDHETDPTHPDYFVHPSENWYDVTGGGAYEDLVYADLGAGEIAGVRHVEDPIVVGATQMEIYQYVTWCEDCEVDEGEQLVKRITVVVRYKAPSVNGVNELIRVSSLYSEDTVTVPDVAGSTTSATGATTTTTSGSTTTTAVASCPGDADPPGGGFAIQGGAGAEAGFTPEPQVTLVMDFTDLCEPIVANFNNEGGALGADVVYDATNPDFAWSLSSGDGTKTVGGEVRDGVGNSKPLTDSQIVLDTTKPTVPGTLTRTASCAGSDRTVNLFWGASTDTNFRSYRVYWNTGSGWSELATTDALSYSHTHKKSLDTISFYVVGYDKAGNESDATNTIALSKNACS